MFLHDCLPPSEPFAREQYLWSFESGGCWSGTSWKSFARYLETGEHAAWVVPTDWGVGVIDTARSSRAQLKHGSNPFFEYDLFVEQLKASGRIVQPASFLAECCRR